jgi:hypothetical protein
MDLREKVYVTLIALGFMGTAALWWWALRWLLE